MKNKASVVLQKVWTVFSSMAKAKTMALKSKTRSIKARLVIFSLLTNKKFLMTSLSQKFQSLLGQKRYPNEEIILGEPEALPDPEEQSKTEVLREIANTCESLPNPTKSQLVKEEMNEQEVDHDNCHNEEDDEKYPDLTHSLFDSDDLNFEGSVIDMVKNSRQEAGKEFNLEEDIDHVADLFIRKFHKQMVLQNLHSIKEHR